MNRHTRHDLIQLDNKLDYWLMFIDGDITLETLVELLNDYV